MATNGDGVRGHSDCVFSLTSAAQAVWFGPEVGGLCALFCVHQVNRMNSCNGSTMMVLPSSCLLLVLSLLVFKYYIGIIRQVHEVNVCTLSVCLCAQTADSWRRSTFTQATNFKCDKHVPETVRT